MQKSTLTRPLVNDLSYLFGKIRSTRDHPTRRSWQRRARLELAKIDSLTEADRHEIMCCWGNRTVDPAQIDSPAMRRLHNHDRTALPTEHLPAAQFTRAAYDLNGHKKRRIVAPFWFKHFATDTVAANDPSACTPDTPPRLQRPCTPALTAYHDRPPTPPDQQSPAPAHCGSDTPPAYRYGNPAHQHRPPWRGHIAKRIRPKLSRLSVSCPLSTLITPYIALVSLVLRL